MRDFSGIIYINALISLPNNYFSSHSPLSTSQKCPTSSTFISEGEILEINICNIHIHFITAYVWSVKDLITSVKYRTKKRKVINQIPTGFIQFGLAFLYIYSVKQPKNCVSLWIKKKSLKTPYPVPFQYCEYNHTILHKRKFLNT